MECKNIVFSFLTGLMSFLVWDLDVFKIFLIKSIFVYCCQFAVEGLTLTLPVVWSINVDSTYFLKSGLAVVGLIFLCTLISKI